MLYSDAGEHTVKSTKYANGVNPFKLGRGEKVAPTMDPEAGVVAAEEEEEVEIPQLSLAMTIILLVVVTVVRIHFFFFEQRLTCTVRGRYC